MMRQLFFTLLLVANFISVKGQTDFRQLTYEEALSVAKKENKKVFIDFYTVWCGPCNVMTQNVFPQKKVGDFLNKHFVCIKLNAEKEGFNLAKQFMVTGFPTFIGVDRDGKELFRKIGSADADEFITIIKSKIDPEKSFDRLKMRYDAGERNAELVSTYAGLVMDKNKVKKWGTVPSSEAHDIVYSYFKDLKKNDRLAAENLFIYEKYTRTFTEEISQYMLEHRKDFDPSIKEAIEKQIKKICNQQIVNLLAGTIPYDEIEYQAVKKEIQTWKIHKKEYTAAFNLIECRTKGDLLTYLELFEKTYYDLMPNMRNSLIANFSRSVNTKDKAILKRMVKCIRNLLPDMDATMLFFVAQEINNLEQLIK